MSIFKCKMCGGALEINGNESVAVCEYCGTRQTLPKLDDEKRANLYDRANHFRRNNDYDKAAGIYEQILSEDGTDAEAYWSLVLCRYGIEYVEDPASHRRVPTVNRAQFTSVFDDDNYKSALEYADGYQRAIYEEEAKAINEIQKGILAISQREEPFDVFICYKETDANGRSIERDAIYTKANQIIDNAITETEINKAIQMLLSIPDYLDSKELAGKCKEEWKRNFDRYTVLVANYKALLQKASGVSREQQIKNEINKLSSKKSHIERLSTSFPNDSRELDATESEIKLKKEKISALQTERASLGIFAGKRKKEIDGNVFVLQKDIDTLSSKASQLKNALSGYSNIDEINSKISSIDSQIGKLQTELMEVEAQAEELGSIYDVINELLSANIIKFVLKNASILRELMKNSTALYGVKLPQKIIDELEGTDDKFYYVNKKDCRTEAQIVADFEKYFAYTFFAEYEIARDVKPTYFGAHPKCKPMHFLFRKDGKDVLAVAVLKYSNLTHPAVKSVKLACKNRGIPYLHFIVGCPNKEHYVVRRVLEELGEIDYFYTDYSWQRVPLKQLQGALELPYNDTSTRDEIKERIEFRKKYKINI